MFTTRKDGSSKIGLQAKLFESKTGRITPPPWVTLPSGTSYGFAEECCLLLLLSSLYPVSGNAVMLCAHLVDNDNKLQSYLYYGTAIPWFGTRSIVAREKKIRRRLRRNLVIQITLLGNFPKKDATKQMKEKWIGRCSLFLLSTWTFKGRKTRNCSK